MQMASTPGYDLLQEGKFALAAEQFEKQINQTDRPEKVLYYYLGLAYLLAGSEEEAQLTWFLASSEDDDDEAHEAADSLDNATAPTTLLTVLETEAAYFLEAEKREESWLISQHLCALAPDRLKCHLYAIYLSVLLQRLELDQLTALKESNLLNTSNQFSSEESKLLFDIVTALGDQNYPIDADLIGFIRDTATHLPDPSVLVPDLLPLAVFNSYARHRSSLGSELGELCLDLAGNNKLLRLGVLRELAPMQQNARLYEAGISSARQAVELSETTFNKLASNHILLRGLTGAGGHWDEALATLELQKSLLRAMIPDIGSLSHYDCMRLPGTLFFLPHFEDAPASNRQLQNQTMRAFCDNIARALQTELQDTQAAVSESDQKLKIGYLSHCFRKHSVGWLARWLISHHDKENFEVHLYSVNHSLVQDSLADWYRIYADELHEMGTNAVEIAQQIKQDGIDILIDLDSITLDVSCNVMCLKPAPVQATWLGLDASGIPTIDYFIADNYVLPETAQSYYSEKIVRLPETYLAVDGFEVGVPTLSRASLDIPPDAIVYFTAQRGYKRHIDNVRLQMQILKQVPNSYLCIKGLADQDAIQDFFKTMAAEAGLCESRLRFLPLDPSESVHRANLRIADVVLDTFPYNGATTTMEVLWMEIPLVTLVGQQFAARNSYTMLKNVGIEEGIAWTPEEYIGWAVKLGQDPELRKDIAWRLRQSKQTAPLWNAKAFTKQMESAYQEMWLKYKVTHSQK